LANPANAQVTVKLQIPPLNQLRMEDLWKVTITNSTTNKYVVYLSGSVKEKKAGQIVNSISSTFSIPPGTKTVTPGSITSSKTNWSNNNFKEIILRTGSAPNGEYNVCVKVLLEFDNNELASDCIVHSVKSMSNINLRLLYPRNSDTISLNNLNFSWTPVVGLLNDSKYILKIVSINKGQSVETAIKNNTPLYQKDLNISTTSHTYPISGPELSSEKKYAC
jgi:hypothetical protein